MKFKKIKESIRESRRTRDFLVFLIFVAIAAIFWYIMALNDESQNSFDLPLQITEVPDTVTFISDPPEVLHITVRDRGLNLMRYKVSGLPRLNINFREYSGKGRLRVSHTALQSAVRKLFGSNASVSSVTPDSLNLLYTTYPGHRLPLILDYDVTVIPGMVLMTPQVASKSVLLYSTTNIDTVKDITTERVVLRNLDRNTTVTVPLKQPSGMRVIPETVDVTFGVEQLVKKESDVAVEADNVPLGHDILFFPSRVRVSYYVPMSKYADNDSPVKVEASFKEAYNTTSDKVGVKVVSKSPWVSNVELLQDSVEYTVVQSN